MLFRSVDEVLEAALQDSVLLDHSIDMPDGAVHTRVVESVEEEPLERIEYEHQWPVSGTDH